jgi:hypothetical protein
MHLPMPTLRDYLVSLSAAAALKSELHSQNPDRDRLEIERSSHNQVILLLVQCAGKQNGPEVAQAAVRHGVELINSREDHWLFFEDFFDRSYEEWVLSLFDDAAALPPLAPGTTPGEA